ncbi:MAG: AzlD domain-containing protein [Anaerosomatales bacterium]|nr:AzlD domain-containing protein [Anaerosomatales bacterium]MDT8433143.1 AzlD domain-containing protein [Anaerosomatales bacterium]
MSSSYIWAVVAFMAVANYAVRFPPIAIVSRLRLPEQVVRWLSYVPAAVMGSLVAGEVLRPAGEYLLTLRNPYLLAAVPTAFIYHRTRSFLGATVAGMLIFVGIRALLG